MKGYFLFLGNHLVVTPYLSGLPHLDLSCCGSLFVIPNPIRWWKKLISRVLHHTTLTFAIQMGGLPFQRGTWFQPLRNRQPCKRTSMGQRPLKRFRLLNRLLPMTAMEGQPLLTLVTRSPITLDFRTQERATRPKHPKKDLNH